MQSNNALLADGHLDAGGFRVLIDQCREGLDIMRDGVVLDGADPVCVATVAELRKAQQRLNRAAECLEKAAGAVTHMADCAARTDSASATAEILAREADHRIKNSLQTVISLLHRQAASAEQDSVRDALYVASARVTAVAQVHATLHADTTPYGVMPELDLKPYPEGLCMALGKAMGMDGSHRIIQVNLAPWAVSPAVAQSIGLAVSELGTNALRHAFWPDRPGTVNVTGSCDSRGGYRLCIEDDGRGLPRGFDLRRRPELRSRAPASEHAGQSSTSPGQR